jgi:hypothetical protein
MEQVLFAINCMTCHARLGVRSPEAIGAILECPKCGSMIEVLPPPGWRPPQATEKSSMTSSPEQTSTAAGDACAAAASSGGKWMFLGIKHLWFWLVAAPAAALVLGLVAWLTVFSGSDSDYSNLPAVAQPAGMPADVAENAQGDIAKQDITQSSIEQAPVHEQRGPAIKTELTSGVEDAAKPVAKNAMAETSQQSPGPAEENISALKAAEANTPQTEALEKNASQAKTTEANTSAEIKNRPEQTVVEKNPQSLPSVKGTSKVIKLVAPEAIDVQSRLGEVIPDIELKDMSFGRAIGLVAALSGLPITLDPDAMARLGVTLNDPITVRLKDATLEEILQEVLAKRGMGYVAEDGQVVVSGPAEENEQLYRVSYTVSDLTGDDKAAMDKLIAMVQKLVSPESWRTNGGWGTIEADKTALVVTQTAAVHDQILVFCEKLRNARGRPLRSNQNPKRFELTTRLQQANAALNRQVDANFHQPATLVEILAYLGRQAEVDILIDRQALAVAGLSDKTEVSFVAEKQSLSAALNELLIPLKLGYRASDARTLQVTSQAALESRRELEFYPIAKILNKGHSASDLIEQIKSEISPASWNNTASSGVIYFDPPSNTLIVLQSQPVQGGIQTYLNKTMEKQK